MSLADALLADLDGLSDDGGSPEPEVSQPTAGPSKGPGAAPGFGSMLPPPLPAKALNGAGGKPVNGSSSGSAVHGKRPAGAMDDEGEGEDEVMGEGGDDGTDFLLEGGQNAVGFVPEGGVRPADELDAEEVEKEDMTGMTDVGTVAKLLGGKRLREVLEVSRGVAPGSTLATRNSSGECVYGLTSADGLQGIEKYTDAPSDMSTAGGPLQENPEYHLVVTANNMSVEVDNEILLVHKFVRDHYAPRFPELEQLIHEPWTYLAAVKAIGNAEDLTKAQLPPNTLPAATVLSITLTATSTRGRKLTNPEWLTVQRAVDVAEELRRARESIFAFVESRMAAVAPNLSAIVGTGIAAKLLGLAGGLQAFSRQPSCNIMLFGALKKTLATTHLSAASQQRHTGFIFQSPIVQSAQPEDRRRAQRAVSAKVALAARIDAGKGSRDGSYGKKCFGELQKKIERMAEPPPNKIAKALPIPQETNRKKRGGKR
jgi:U4/U6 small nuclear ribonucleoprotein PRP31